LGVCQSRHGKRRYEEAVASFSKAIEYDSNYTAALNNKAWYLAELGRYDEALNVIDKCLEIDKDDYYALDTKGYILDNQGHTEEAINYYKRALDLKSDYESAKSNLERVLLKKGKKL
jgi:tetratricopeptide (TPR) repeat protein